MESKPTEPVMEAQQNKDKFMDCFLNLQNTLGELVKMEVPQELKTEEKKSVEKIEEKEIKAESLMEKARRLFEEGSRACQNFKHL